LAQAGRLEGAPFHAAMARSRQGKGDVNLVAGPLSAAGRLTWDDRRQSITGPHPVALPLSRDAAKVAFTLEDVLSADECVRLVEAAESMGFAQAGLGRSGEQVVCTEFRDSGRLITEDPALAQLIFRRVHPHLPRLWRGRRLLGLNEQLKFLRYHPGQKFAAHYDGAFVRPGTQNRTCLTLQLYLSTEHVEGGATIFCGYEGAEKGARCEPRAGRVLIFQHNLLHEGEQVRSGVKYTIRTDVEYGPVSATAWAQEALGFGHPGAERAWRYLFMLLLLLPLLFTLLRGGSLV